MTYIAHEEFLKADKSVRDTILKWQNNHWLEDFEVISYKPFVSDSNNPTKQISILFATVIENKVCGSLTVQHMDVEKLIGFINSKGVSIQITINADSMTIIDIISSKVEHSRFIKSSLIDALWEVAQKVCE